MNPIDITSIIPIGMNKEQAIKLGQSITGTMSEMWHKEGSPQFLNPEEFARKTLSYCKTAESKAFLAEKITRVFSEKEIGKIIKTKNDLVSFVFEDEEIIVKREILEPA